MAGRLMNTIINILFLTYIILLISFYFLHQTLKNNVDEANYALLNTVATTGVFSEDMYDQFKKNVFRYGGGMTYKVTIKYEKKINPGVYITSWKKDWISARQLSNSNENDEILTYVGRPIPMKIGDKISIYLEAQQNTLFVKLLNAPFLGMAANSIDMKIKSLKPAEIGRNANNLNKGYEVIADVNQKKAANWLNGHGSPVTIRVVTELNQNGKYYGKVGTKMTMETQEVEFTDDNYDLAALEDDEKYDKTTRKIGENYIQNTGEFYRQVTEYYNLSTLSPGEKISDYEKVIEYIQK